MTVVGRLAAVILAAGGLAWSAAATELVLFYEQGCPHCARLEVFLEGIAPQYPELEISRHEIHDPQAQRLLDQLLDAYGAQLGPVPIVFVGDVAAVGGTFYGLTEAPQQLAGRAEELALEQAIAEAIADQAPSPLTKVSEAATVAVLVTQAEECPACLDLEQRASELRSQYPELGVQRVVMDGAQGAETFERLCRLYGVRGNPPALFVGQVAVVGGEVHLPRRDPLPLTTPEATAALEEAVRQAVAAGSASPLDRLRLRERLTLGAVVLGAALDSINPCDFAVLVLLLGTLLVVGKRVKVIWAGLAFSAGIFVAYFAIGFLLYSVLGFTVGTRAFREPFIIAVSSLAILVGLWQMKDLLWYGKYFSIEVPERWKPSVTRITASVASVPGALVIGLLDSLFLAPCTSGPYLVILTLLSQTATRWQGAGMLLLYNFIFILPMVAITLMVHFGLTTTARAERWRQAELGKLHFATGLVMFLLGVGMIVGVRLGYL
ncbi:MAG: cytochrome c biogenesis protein CcdA [Candidatus Bipolaricaulaceae bacterium]